MDVRVKDIIKDNSIWLPSQDYNEKKKLSILMPTFGRGKNGFFKRAVTSYIEQTFKDTELILVDDANILYLAQFHSNYFFYFESKSSTSNSAENFSET